MVRAEGFLGNKHMRGCEVIFNNLATFVVCKPSLQADVTAQAPKSHCDVSGRTTRDFGSWNGAVRWDNDIHQCLSDGEDVGVGCEVHISSCFQTTLAGSTNR